MIKPVLFLSLSCLSAASAFVFQNTAFRKPTRIFLEDHVADMVDQEFYRQQHKKDWVAKNTDQVLHSFHPEEGVGSGSSPLMMDQDDMEEFRQHRKDVKMAKTDPEKYCADRCVSTGNCDVYEDYFELSAEEVIQFCTDCVLSEEEEPCDVPDAFYDNSVDFLMP